jgi:hypothetical protein
MGVVVEGVGRGDGCLGGEGVIKVGYDRVEEVEWGGEGEGVRGRWGETYLRRGERGEDEEGIFKDVYRSQGHLSR